MASPSVRVQLGDSLKSALSYTFRTGTYDEAVFPLYGRGFRCSPVFWPASVLELYVWPAALR